jgi:hypothetical protein
MSILQSIGRLLRYPTRALARRLGLTLDEPRSSATFSGESAPERRAEHADERTIRRVGEAQLGGTSSEASREAYARGENPGGLRHGGTGPMPAHGHRESRR